MLSEDAISKKLDQVYRCYGKAFDMSTLGIWVKALRKYDSGVFAGVCDKWCMKERKPPFLSEIVNECSRLSSWVEDKSPPSMAIRCAYHNPEESAISRKLCRAPTIDDAQLCQQGERQFVCGWHKKVIEAAQFPDGPATCYVKTMLELTAAEGDPYRRTGLYLRYLGFDPFDTDKAKHDDSQRIKGVMADLYRKLPGQESRDSKFGTDKSLLMSSHRVAK